MQDPYWFLVATVIAMSLLVAFVTGDGAQGVRGFLRALPQALYACVAALAGMCVALALSQWAWQKVLGPGAPSQIAVLVELVVAVSWAKHRYARRR